MVGSFTGKLTRKNIQTRTNYLYIKHLNIYKSRVTMFVLNGLLNHLTDYNKIRTPCAVRSNLIYR